MRARDNSAGPGRDQKGTVGKNLINSKRQNAKETASPQKREKRRVDRE